ncbi:MAG: BamA/TamA family outer membrane protein [Polyangiaceae bacterium]|nr:BamA/TamA family outer membrane protein [Polyangiaceae bacterium]
MSALTRTAIAQQPAPVTSAKPTKTVSDLPIAPPIPKRSIPNYDGRPPPQVTAAEQALWIPRAIFFPLYLTTEYLLRRPIGWLVSVSEKYAIPLRVIDFFSFGENRKGMILPTLFADFGLRPSVGIYFRLNDEPVEGNDIRVHAATWGEHWLHLIVTDRFTFQPGARAVLRVEGTRRADHQFAGIGPLSGANHLSRYTADQLDATVSVEWSKVWRGSRVTTLTGVRALGFPEQLDCCIEPLLESLIRYGTLPSPPGFKKELRIVRQQVEVEMDSRDDNARSGLGFRAETYGELAFGISDTIAHRWVKWGAAAGAFLDLTGERRTVGLLAAVDLVHPLGSENVPFTELVSLGGEGLLRSFVPGRLRGESGVAAGVEYRWPTWVWLDGLAYLSVGNVLGPQFSNFSPSIMRAAFGIGLRTRGLLDNSFEFTVGGGTDPFEQGGKVTAFRFTLGTAPRF